MAMAPVNGIRLFYEERGRGQPLVFLNGLSGDHLYWKGQLRTFGRKYLCLALDNRDVGQSDYVAQPYSVRELAADVAGWLDQLQIRAAHVVGLSMGGMIAQELALARPDLVRSLFLADTLGRADEWFRGTLHAFTLIRRQTPDTPAFFDAIMPWWVSPRFFETTERATWLRWLLRQTPHPQRIEGFLHQIEAMQNHDALDRLHLLRCPTFVLTGEDDCVTPPRYARRLGQALAHAEVCILPGVGHAPPLEEPRLFNDHLAKFIAQVEVGVPALAG